MEGNPMIEKLLEKYQKQYEEGMVQLERIERQIQELNKQGQDLVTRLNVITGKIEGLHELNVINHIDESEVVENGEQN